MTGKRKQLSDAPEVYQSKTWAWTFYYEEEEALALIARLTADSPPWKAIRFQREICPTTGRQHLQGCCAMEKKCTRTRIQNLISPARPTQVSARACYSEFKNSWEYTSKPETRDTRFEHVVHGFGDPFGHDDPKLDADGRAEVLIKLAEAGDWSTLRAEHQSAWLYSQKMLREARAHAITCPDVLDGILDNYWIYGEAGEGKDMYALQLAPAAYVKAGNTKWWNGYDGQADVILRDVGRTMLPLLDEFKVWTDRYKFPAETKGGQMVIRPTRIMVTSNYSPAAMFKGDPVNLAAILRRFRVVNLRNGVPIYHPRVNVDKPIIHDPVFLEQEDEDI